MHEFNILLRSFRDVEQFVSLAMVQPFEVTVSCKDKRINGKNYMGMSTLDFSRPLQVLAKCSDDDFARFRSDASAFLIE